MKTMSLIQGSQQWLEYRATHYNASDAPAMLGVSPYKTRSELLYETATGIYPDIDDATQAIFDDGHRFEALARPLADAIVGEDLYPVTGEADDGILSASFDGLTGMGTVAFEHKSLNNAIREAFASIETIAPEYRERNAGRELPIYYRVQMEQQLMVCETCERVLFMATRWDADGNLLEELHCWYYSDPDLRAQIGGGWEQFGIDVSVYVVPEVKGPAPVGRTPENLPALRIELTGIVTANNLQEYRDHAIAVVQSISTELTTDQHFADADKTAKWCGEVEDRLEAAKNHALSQAESVDQLFRMINEISGEFRTKRLELEKLIDARKKKIKQDIVTEAQEGLQKHLEQIIYEVRVLMPQINADFGAATKNKRTFDSMRNAVQTELARVKVEATQTSHVIYANLRLLDTVKDHKALFADLATIVLKDPEHFELLVKSRIAEYEAAEEKRLEADRERIREEEQAKAQREAQPGIAAAVTVTAVGQAATAAPITTPLQANVINMTRSKPIGQPGLKLGEIGTLLGFNLTADFLRAIGFDVALKDRGACLYHREHLPAMLEALENHVRAIRLGEQAQAA